MATRSKAAEKPAPKTTAKKSTSTAITLWEQEMEQAAVAQSATEQHVGGYKSVSLKGGILSIDDNPVEDNEIRVVILSGIHENQMYEGNYNPEKPTTPSCYAFGDNEDEMSPHEASTNKQADLCSSCWANEWGSADIGKGKACKNVRRLVLITEDALESAESLEEAEERMLKLPVMSVKNWTTYVKDVLAEQLKRPSWGVVTTIKVVPDAKSQFRVQFKFEELVQFDQELYDAMKKKAEQARKNSASAYPVFEEDEEPAKPQRRTIPIKPAGKTTAAKAAPSKRGGKY
jgi:hypothetical protein